MCGEKQSVFKVGKMQTHVHFLYFTVSLSKCASSYIYWQVCVLYCYLFYTLLSPSLRFPAIEKMDGPISNKSHWSYSSSSFHLQNIDVSRRTTLLSPSQLICLSPRSLGVAPGRTADATSRSWTPCEERWSGGPGRYGNRILTRRLSLHQFGLTRFQVVVITNKIVKFDFDRLWIINCVFWL